MKIGIYSTVFLLFELVAIVHDVNGQQPLFTLLPAKETNISFVNKVIETDSLHVMNYEYLYNGSGVGVADFNGDGLSDVFFSSNSASHKLYMNKGDLKFEDITNKAGLSGNGTWGTGVSIADVNGDGLLDIYVCHSGKHSDDELKNELFINQGIKGKIPVFKNMAEVYGLDARGTQSTQAVFFDYDKDGDLDMFLLNHSNQTYKPFVSTKKVRATPNMKYGNRLFRNDPKNNQPYFVDVTITSGIINNALNFGLNVAVSDLNSDGWPDIYTSSDYTEQDCLYINNKNGTFSETIRKSIKHISKFSMGSDIADYNNDGKPDIITLDMLPEDNRRQKLLKGPDEYDQYHLLLDSGYYNQQMRNMLHLNQGLAEDGHLRFSEIGQLAGISNTDWSWAPLFADFDNDGWKDLFISNGYLRDFTDMDFLKYTVANAQVESLKQGSLKFQTFDLVKKMPSNKISNYIFSNNRDLTFTNQTKAWGISTPSVSNGSAYADLDNDGDLDLIVCNINSPIMVYRNNSNLEQLNYLKIKLVGAGLNTSAVGAKIYVKTKDNLQYQEKYVVRGYQSSVDQINCFGLGKNNTIDEVKVVWPDGKETLIENIQSNKTLTVRQNEAKIKKEDKGEPKALFADFTAQSGLTFRHIENDFIDFKGETLLPYQLSKFGPALATADVNNDGIEDVFLGGAIGQESKLYLGNKKGGYNVSKSQPWDEDKACEDVNAVFFDANGDGFSDLWVVSGGNEYNEDSPEYQDRLYLNDGNGIFSKAKNALPKMWNSKQAISFADFDQDGDLDVFVGGMSKSGAFPLCSKSYLLCNNSKGGVAKFENVTKVLAPELEYAGMVVTAIWQDLDADKHPELLIGGDWMALKKFKNEKGVLKIDKESGLENSDGMWSKIVSMDVNNDGAMDFIAGNCGLNNQFKANDKQPTTIYVADFNNDDVLDPIMCYYIQGQNYPMASRDELLDQMVQLKKRFLSYASYADLTIEQLLTPDQLSKSQKFYCKRFETSILLNDGSGKFAIKALPIEAQISRTWGIITDDFNKDGKQDILLGGNFYPYRVQLGQADASLGLLLFGNGKGDFKAVPPYRSGFYIDGDVRNMIEMKGETKKIIVVKNNDQVQLLKATN
ncbi:VCBS repeat-containing protein [Pedobacter endophyticus]|uniref:VCBS repeat-containing protein n=1 Tax=Pedobacter endophyticus TaxID=2789740 RepID=A0A7S9Q0W8_9SPHI|nr:VCBS repeat-containing protein [Pedobacter endophyticus]QPH41152.1 VCBS repeat-containing protein [Pedobacter endophyticus]